ncbi:MAG: CRTAC1 family protein [Myxococcota bacterium]
MIGGSPRPTAFPFLLLAGALAGCGQVQVGGDGAAADAGPADAGTVDPDGGRDDAGVADPDLGRPDLGGVDAGPRPLPEPFFVEVSREVGLDHDQDPSFPPTCTVLPGPCAEGIQTGGAAAGDMNGDGWPDLYFAVMSGHDRLYLNDGDGTFTDVSEAWGLTALENSTSGVAMHDVDRDGDLDVYVAGYGERRHYLWLNTGSGLVERGLGMGATPVQDRLLQGQSVAFGDYDGDGWADVYVVEWVFDHLGYVPRSRTMLVRNRLGEGMNRFEEVTAEAGVTADGWPTYDGREGTFGLTPVFTDLDDDGLVDLYVAADFGASRMFWNAGDGTFDDGTEVAAVNLATNAMGVAVGDLDGDLDFDMYVTSISDPDESKALTDPGANRLYMNQGDRTFTEESFVRRASWGDWGWGVAAEDMDHDGDLDLVQCSGFNRADGREFYFENDGRGFFDEIGRERGFGRAGQGRALVMVDYDRDGDSDVLVVRHDDAPILYRNDLPRRMHWVRLRVLDERGADALGARVTLRQGEQAWLREVRSGGTFNGSDEPWIDVGLGPAGDVPCEVEVEVRWPLPERETTTTTVTCNDWQVIRRD